MPHRSKSSGSYPKSRPLDPGMRCSSSFAPQSSWRGAMLKERGGRDRESKSIFSSEDQGQGEGQGPPPPPPPRARTFAEYLQTPATERSPIQIPINQHSALWNLTIPWCFMNAMRGHPINPFNVPFLTVPFILIFFLFYWYTLTDLVTMRFNNT